MLASSSRTAVLSAPNFQNLLFTSAWGLRKQISNSLQISHLEQKLFPFCRKTKGRALEAPDPRPKGDVAVPWAWRRHWVGTGSQPRPRGLQFGHPQKPTSLMSGSSSLPSHSGAGMRSSGQSSAHLGVSSSSPKSPPLLTLLGGCPSAWGLGVPWCPHYSSGFCWHFHCPKGISTS